VAYSGLPAAPVDQCCGIEVGRRVEGQEPAAQHQPPQVVPRALLRAPATTSMITGSVTTSGPSAAIDAVMRSSTGLPVAPSYSIHGCVGEDHAAPRGATSAGTSPIA
jgi:hypothetical protein